MESDFRKDGLLFEKAGILFDGCIADAVIAVASCIRGR